MYETVTKVRIDFPELISPPFFSFCSRIGEIVDRDKAWKEANINFDNDGRFHFDVFNNLTLKQIFEMTPTAEEAFIECSIRMPGQYLFHTFYEDKCNGIYDIRKYFMQEYMCYVAGLNKPDKYNFVQLSQAEQARGTIYFLRLNNTLFGRSKYVLNVAHPSPTAGTSRYYAVLLQRKFQSGSNRSNEVVFEYSYSQFVYKLLPLPYDTACGMNDGKTSAVCHQQCLTKHMLARAGKLTTSWIITEYSDWQIDIDRKLLTVNDFKENETILNEFLAADSECAAKCKRPPCIYSRYNTDLQTLREVENTTYIEIKLSLPQFPTISVSYEPEYELNDFVLLLLSCMGTWLGLSVFDFNPVKMCIGSTKCECSRKLRSLNAICIFLRSSNVELKRSNTQLAQQLNTVRQEAIVTRANVAQQINATKSYLKRNSAHLLRQIDETNKQINAIRQELKVGGRCECSENR